MPSLSRVHRHLAPRSTRTAPPTAHSPHPFAVSRHGTEGVAVHLDRASAPPGAAVTRAHDGRCRQGAQHRSLSRRGAWRLARGVYGHRDLRVGRSAFKVGGGRIGSLRATPRSLVVGDTGRRIRGQGEDEGVRIGGVVMQNQDGVVQSTSRGTPAKAWRRSPCRRTVSCFSWP